MARYRVTQEPGVQVPGVGFYRLHEEFHLPDDATPSRFLIPLDEAAVKALTRTKQAYVAQLEQRLADQEPPRKLSAADRKAHLHVPPIGGGAEHAQPPKAEEQPKQKQTQGGRRASDSDAL